jgi:hypothetical protein
MLLVYKITEKVFRPIRRNVCHMKLTNIQKRGLSNYIINIISGNFSHPSP